MLSAGGVIVLFRDIRIAKELERRREEWTSLIAHDLREPVSVISLTAELFSSFMRESSLRKRESRLSASMTARGD